MSRVFINGRLNSTTTVMINIPSKFRLHVRLQECNGDEVWKAKAGAKIRTNYATYKKTDTLHEKYDVEVCGKVGGGGEYIPQVRKLVVLDGSTIFRSEKVKDELVSDGNDIELVSRSVAVINQFSDNLVMGQELVLIHEIARSIDHGLVQGLVPRRVQCPHITHTNLRLKDMQGKYLMDGRRGRSTLLPNRNCTYL